MKEQHERTSLLLGEEAMEKLFKSRVLLFGLGGVGSPCAEALARAGVGEIHVVDSDKVSLSNINRQIIALHSTVGKNKTEVTCERIADISPDTKVVPHTVFFLAENCDDFDFSSFDYVIDAIDTVSAKLAIIEKCHSLGVPVISCMGTGNKTDPQSLTVSDIYKTSVCPLAKVMRYELRKRGVKKLKVVWSPEEPKKVSALSDENRRSIPASCSFVPPVAGYIMAGEVIKDIISK